MSYPYHHSTGQPDQHTNGTGFYGSQTPYQYQQQREEYLDMNMAYGHHHGYNPVANENDDNVANTGNDFPLDMNGNNNGYPHDTNGNDNDYGQDTKENVANAGEGGNVAFASVMDILNQLNENDGDGEPPAVPHGSSGDGEPPAVPNGSSGEGLPYAPENWPNPGDKWSWRVGKRVENSGYYTDRFLYLPKSLVGFNTPKQPFGSKPAVERYIAENFPGADINAFFASFTWEIRSTEGPKLIAVSEFQSQSGFYRGSQPGWTMREDEVLCDCWSTISEDTIIGTNQSGGTMWQRIHAMFKRDLPDNPADRTPDALASRWKLMQKFLNKFNALVIAIEREAPSGSTHESRLQMARHAYQTEMNKPFRYEQCWFILHQCPKWNAAFETKMSKGRRAKEVQSSPASTDSPAFQSQSGFYRGSQPGWTMREDEVLCNCWSTISEDTVIGTNQSGGTMWQRIHAMFKRDLPDNLADRTSDALASRWKLMQKFLNKFNALVIAIEREAPSDSTHESRLQMARHAYQTEMNKPFRYEQCWFILHQCPKWNAAFETKMSKGRRAKEFQSSPASTDSPAFQSQSGFYRGSQPGWTMRENEVLCDCWSTISEDTVIGTNQSGGTMWQRIHAMFKRDLPDNPTDRTPDALASRWKLMQKILNKFNALVIAIEREAPSGSTHESRLQMARHAYQTEMNKPFRYEQCWFILHQCPKWNAAFETKMSRGRRAKEVQASPVSTDSPGTAESNQVERPEGTKKSKERKRKSSESTELMKDFFKNLQGQFNMEANSSAKVYNIRHEELDATRKKTQAMKEKTEALKEKNRIKRWEAESRIIAINLDGLTGQARELMKMQQKEIMKKWASQFGGGSSGFDFNN